MLVNDDTFPVVSQTQDEIVTQPVDDGFGNENSPISSNSKGSEHDDISKQLNTVIDKTYDYLAVEIKAIDDHMYLADILEVKVEYAHGE